MTHDPAAERRSEKLSVLLQGLENYITELAKTNHGARPEAIVFAFKKDFERSMTANSDYHARMADVHRKDGDNAMADFHKLHADIYKSLIAEI